MNKNNKTISFVKKNTLFHNLCNVFIALFSAKNNKSAGKNCPALLLNICCMYYYSILYLRPA
jgi:hypothetical protein